MTDCKAINFELFLHGFYQGIKAQDILREGLRDSKKMSVGLLSHFALISWSRRANSLLE